MKYLRLLNILPVGLFIFALLALPAMAVQHTVDGDLTDWGVTLSDAYIKDEANNRASDGTGWMPGSAYPTVDWIVENNICKNYEAGKLRYGGTDLFVWAGNKYGTHKTKTGTSGSVSDYEELLIKCQVQSEQEYIQPAGGEAYDIEALYFDDDPQYAYFAIVTSVPQGGSGGHLMGDIALDLKDDIDSTLTGGTIVPYEYGIKVIGGSGFVSGALVSKPEWTKPDSNDFPENYPYTMKGGTGTVIGTPADSSIQIKYTNNNIPDDNGLPNYVIELRIPRNKIGNPNAGQLSKIHLTIGCGNDVIDLNPVKFKTNIPEFPSIVLPVAAIMGIILILDRRNKSK